MCPHGQQVGAHGAVALLRLSIHCNVSAVTTSVSATPPIHASRKGIHSRSSVPKYTIMPATNGMKSSIRCLSKWWQVLRRPTGTRRSEEHTSELQSLMRLSYADICLKKTKKQK